MTFRAFLLIQTGDNHEAGGVPKAELEETAEDSTTGDVDAPAEGSTNPNSYAVVDAKPKKPEEAFRSRSKKSKKSGEEKRSKPNLGLVAKTARELGSLARRKG